MRAFPTLVFTLAAACAFGQITSAEQPIQDALVALRANSSAYFQLEGTDTLGAKTSNLVSSAFWSWDPAGDSFAKSDLLEWVNGQQTRRTCGDGTVLWAYDFRANAYTNTRYGTYAGQKDKYFRSNLLQAMGTAAQGPTIFLTRLLRETFGGELANYRTWLPGAEVATVGDGQYKDDAVSGRRYTGSQLDYFIVYTYPRMSRSNAFHLHRNSLTEPFALQTVYYTDVQNIRNASRVLDWKIVVNPITGLTTNYEFIPPKTARAIANVRVNSGG